MIFEIVIPGKEQGKGRPRFSKYSGAYTPAPTVRYEKRIANAFREKYPNHKLIDEAIELEMESYFYVPKSWTKKKKAQAFSGEMLPLKKPDIDNVLKIVDGLNNVAWTDDALITDARIKKRYASAPNEERLIIKFKKKEN